MRKMRKYIRYDRFKRINIAYVYGNRIKKIYKIVKDYFFIKEGYTISIRKQKKIFCECMPASKKIIQMAVAMLH